MIFNHYLWLTILLLLIFRYYFWHYFLWIHYRYSYRQSEVPILLHTSPGDHPHQSAAIWDRRNVGEMSTHHSHQITRLKIQFKYLYSTIIIIIIFYKLLFISKRLCHWGELDESLFTRKALLYLSQCLNVSRLHLI